MRGLMTYLNTSVENIHGIDLTQSSSDLYSLECFVKHLLLEIKVPTLVITQQAINDKNWLLQHDMLHNLRLRQAVNVNIKLFML